MRRIRARWRQLLSSLGFVPGVFVAVFAVLGIVVVELDRTLELGGARLVFQGDGAAARTVLSVIAGSLITVAGLTFSITMVALQLASSQFSPRVLRTFFADRITQITIGTYVGVFVYAMLVLRSVGSYGDSGFVPRLSVTLASLFGIAAVVLLIVFLQHVALMIQVSHVMGAIAHDTLRHLNALYPERYGRPAGDGEELERWREQGAGTVFAAKPGYVVTVELQALADDLAGEADRLAVLVCPGDFASIDTPIAEVWPAEAEHACRANIRQAITIRRERDLGQDVDFGLRQLADTALKALSPGVNDPATAVTCIGYIRAILVRLVEREFPAAVRRFPEQNLTVYARVRGFGEHLEVVLQLSRYVGGDAWVARELLAALEACAHAAARSGAQARAECVTRVARTVAAQAAREAGNPEDRESVERSLAAVVAAGAPDLPA